MPARVRVRIAVVVLTIGFVTAGSWANQTMLKRNGPWNEGPSLFGLGLAYGLWMVMLPPCSGCWPEA